MANFRGPGFHTNFSEQARPFFTFRSVPHGMQNKTTNLNSLCTAYSCKIGLYCSLSESSNLVLLSAILFSKCSYIRILQTGGLQFQKLSKNPLTGLIFHNNTVLSFLDFPKSRYTLFTLQKLMFSTNFFAVHSNSI